MVFTASSANHYRQMKPRPRRAEAEARRETKADAQAERASSRERESRGERRIERGAERERERETQRETRRAGRERERSGREIETQRERERELRTRAMKAKCWSSCCALSNIRGRTTDAVAMHLESGLPEHANERHRKRSSSACSRARSRNACALLHKTHACDNTGYTEIPVFLNTLRNGISSLKT